MSSQFMPIKVGEVEEGDQKRDVVIWAEVQEIEPRDSIEMAAFDAEKLATFEAALQGLCQAAQKAKAMLEVVAPDEVEMAFGITVGAEAGTPFFGLAKASSEASYTVKITWKKTPSSTKKP